MLHVIRETNCSDIPAMLRLLATDVAEGNVLAESVTVVVRQGNGEVMVLGYGKTDSVRSFMDLHAGAAELLR